jgi:hypothetical protein
MLTKEQLEFVEMLIRVRFDQPEPVTYSEIITQLELQYGVCLLPDTLRHIIYRIPWCKTIDGVPHEALRIQCDEGEIDRYCQRLEKILEGVPSDVIDNVDEAGSNSWVDASRLRVVVPLDFEETVV